MKKIISPFILVVLLYSCKESEPVSFNRDGVSIKSLAGWTIVEQEPIEDYGYYLAIEKDGHTASALMTVTWTDGESDLKECLTRFQNVLKEEEVHEKSNLKYEKPKETPFGKFKAIASDYSAKIYGIEHVGSMYCFNQKDKTFMILKQEEVAHIKKNKKGFEMIENNFIIE